MPFDHILKSSGSGSSLHMSNHNDLSTQVLESQGRMSSHFFDYLSIS